MSIQGKPRILVLGAGFGGLELTTLLSEQLGDSIDVTHGKVNAVPSGRNATAMASGR